MRVLGIVLIVAFFVVWGFTRFVTLSITDDWIKENLGTRAIKPKVFYGSYHLRPIRWLELGDSTKPVTILLHGAPSSMGGWKSYLEDTSLLSKVCLVAIDRPGYGESGFAEPETSILAQAQALIPIVAKYAKRGRGVRIVASSYGCTVAARIAMTNSNLIDELVLISGSTKPGAEMTYWFSYPLDFFLLNWIVPPVLNVANKEKLSHPAELQKMLPFWKDITTSVTLVHGNKDDLIYYENALFSQKMLGNARKVNLVTVKGYGHYLPWRRQSLVRGLILGKN